jgi:hypothetical protein
MAVGNVPNERVTKRLSCTEGLIQIRDDSHPYWNALQGSLKVNISNISDTILGWPKSTHGHDPEASRDMGSQTLGDPGSGTITRLDSKSCTCIGSHVRKA